MATGGQFYWPSVGTFVAAYGQFFMAANTGGRGSGAAAWSQAAQVIRGTADCGWKVLPGVVRISTPHRDLSGSAEGEKPPNMR